MREHGVEKFPDPEVKGGIARLPGEGEPSGLDVSAQTMRAAQSACTRFAEAAGPQLTPQEKAEREQSVLKEVQCLREHGMDVTTENSPTGGGLGIEIGKLNPESAAFQAARERARES